MFAFAGKEAVAGAIEKLKHSGGDLGAAIVKMAGDMKNVPGLNIPPLVFKIIQDAPQYWERLPDDQKQALFNALVAAGTKALSTYAGSQKTAF